MPAENDEQLLHDLAFLYFTIGYGADGDLDESELSTIRQKLRERYPDLDEETVTYAASSALADYVESSDPMEEASSAVAVVRNRLPDAGRRLVYRDLERVAEADGEVLPEERKLLDLLAEGWELDSEHD